MHPFSQLFQSIQSLGEEEVEVLLGPPEDALPLLEDADLNRRVAEDLLLHLPDHAAEEWVHRVGGLLGLYNQKPLRFNPFWKIPHFPPIHLKEDFVQYLDHFYGPLTAGEKRRFKLSFPARFFPPAVKYLPLYKGIKDKYPLYTLHHFFLTAAYLWNLYEAGITYLRESYHTASFIGHPYPWEQKQLLSHGTKSVSPQSSGVSTSSFYRHLRRRRMGSFHSERPLAPSKVAKSWKLGAGLHPSTHLEHFPGARNIDLRGSRAKEKGEEAHAPHTTLASDTPPSVSYKNSSTSCLWRAFDHTPSCGPNCLKHFFNLHADWGPCPQDVRSRNGKHVLRTPRTPRRITGGVFLVDKNPHNSAESRLVVDFSQFSRGHTKVPWPKFAVPNLRSLTNILSCDLYWLSLDVSSAFYHLPLSPGAMPFLLVGSPGLEGLLTSVSISTGARDKRQHHFLQGLHSKCSRGCLATLLLLHKTFGQQLHMLAHPFIMGFRKIPMGVGLSPFLLAQFTSALASVVRRNFSHCLAFAYMDDMVLGARTPEHLESIYSSVCHLFLSMGIHLNADKTKRWGRFLNFMGLTFSAGGTLPQEVHAKKCVALLKSMPVKLCLDWKIIQRLTGILGFCAPFTKFGYALLMPFYLASVNRTGFTFSAAFKKLLLQQYSALCPVLPQRAGVCQVFADATPTGWGLADHSSACVRGGRYPRPLPIHVAELIAACLARCWTGARLLGSDNSVVCSKKYTHFPWLLGCVANWILRDVSFIYVPSHLNPADAPSRGLLGLRTFPPPIYFRPTTGRTSVYVACQPVASRRAARVSFASPVRTSADAWKPP
nr:polymerase [Equine hepatitis B virus]